LSERMIIQGDGNVGIGTTSPASKLHVYGGPVFIQNTGTNAVGLYVNNNSTSTAGYSYLFNGPRPGTTTGGAVHFINGSGRSDDGGVSTYTIRNDSGNLRLGSASFSTSLEGNVGIGTWSPQFPLHVVGTSTSSLTASYDVRWFHPTHGIYDVYSGAGGQPLTWGGISIYADNDIVSRDHITTHNGIIVASDIRIKKNIVDADDTECLETLRLLKPKKYQYRDTVAKGEEPVWGFIAQEVRDTLPHATQLRKDVLPNIYELANVSQSNVITFVNFNTSNLESNATTLIRTKGIDGGEHDIHLVEVIDEHTIRVEEDLSAWSGSVDETGNVITEITTTTLTPEEYEALEDKVGCVANISGYQNANVVISIEEYNGLEDTTGYEEVIENYTKTTTIYPGTQLFVYGQEVDDFIFVKKEAIWTVATAALQEVDRQLQAEKTKVATLELQLASVLTRLDALESA
jgi:hypothetical protein